MTLTAEVTGMTTRSIVDASLQLERAIDRTFTEHRVLTFQFGGRNGTNAIAITVIEALHHKS